MPNINLFDHNFTSFSQSDKLSKPKAKKSRSKDKLAKKNKGKRNSQSVMEAPMLTDSLEQQSTRDHEKQHKLVQINELMGKYNQLISQSANPSIQVTARDGNGNFSSQ